MARKHITRGIEVLVFDGKVKYIRVIHGHNVKTLPLLGRDFQKTLWNACVTWARWSGGRSEEVEAAYKDARRIILRNYDL